MSGASAPIPVTSSAAIPQTTAPPATTNAAAIPQPTAPLFVRPSQAVISAGVLDTLTTAIYGLQRQMGQLATRMAGGDGRPGSSVHPQSLPFGMPGYGGLPSAPSSGSAIVHPTMASRPVPITQISFPPSPSPLPAPFNTPVYPAAGDPEDGGAVPRFHKLTFPTFDGKADPLDWLNKCDHFFRAQRTREADKVWLASFHMTGAAQHWYYMFERDEGGVAAVSWERFRAMCQQRFAPPWHQPLVRFGSASVSWFS